MKPLSKQYLFTLDIQSVNYGVFFKYYAMLFYVIHSCIALLLIVEKNKYTYSW